MQYTLVTANGKTHFFNVLGAAELYKTIYGGYIIKNPEQLQLAA